jgi:hypothetical protein
VVAVATAAISALSSPAEIGLVIIRIWLGAQPHSAGSASIDRMA